MINFGKSNGFKVGSNLCIEFYMPNMGKSKFFSNKTYYRNIIPYKNRGIDYSKSVQVYKNLNKPGFYSIRQNGLVVAHSDYMEIKATKFVVNEIARQKVVSNKRKVVHAWVEGYLQEHELCTLGLDLEEIYYNPYITDKFIYKNSGEEVQVAKRNCVIFGEKVYIAK